MSTTTLERSRESCENLLSDQYFQESRSSHNLQLQSSLPSTSMDVECPFVLQLGERILFFESKPSDWIVPSLKQFCQLLSLPPNWDSYGGLPVNPQIVEKAVSFLLEVLEHDDPIPAIVPTSRGGIMLEWHEGGIELEIDIQSPSLIHVAFEMDDHEEECDRDVLEFVAEKLSLLRSQL